MRLLSLPVSRQAAFNVAIAGWIPCGAMFAIASLFLGKEEDALQVSTVLKPLKHAGPILLMCKTIRH